MVSTTQYRNALVPFLVWLAFVQVVPELPCEFDDLLCEFRYGGDDAPPVTKSGFEKLVAAVEKILPHMRG